MRRVEPRQLTFVFADSPKGGKGSRLRDESGGRPLPAAYSEGHERDELCHHGVEARASA